MASKGQEQFGRYRHGEQNGVVGYCLHQLTTGDEYLLCCGYTQRRKVFSIVERPLITITKSNCMCAADVLVGLTASDLCLIVCYAWCGYDGKVQGSH